MDYRIALVYSSTQGQTKKIAERIGGRLEEAGCSVEWINAGELQHQLDLSVYDGVIVGSAIYAGRITRPIYRFVRHQLDGLRRLPTALFSVGMLAALESDQEETTTDHIVSDFLDEMKWEPTMVESFAGAIPFTEYGFFRRWLMKWMVRRRTGEKIDASRDYEYTDWEQVDSFADRYLSRVREMAGSGKEAR